VEYVVVIHAAEEGGYWAEVPALEGCFAQGETIEDLLGDARGAIQSHIEALKEDGQAMPRNSSIVVATVSTPEPTPT
jgi:predicted RNase H-like HicB family nuclease